MKPADIARDRRLDADLAEALGNEMPAALADRIASELRQPTAPARKVRAMHGRTRWLAAAAVLLGIVVVTSVATSNGNHSATADRQDPAGLATVTMESLKTKRIKSAAANDGVRRLLDLANFDETSIIITQKVMAPSQTLVEDCTAHEAIERIAAELKVGFAEYNGVLLVGGLGRSGQTGRRVTMHCETMPVAAFLRQLHARAGANLILADNLAGAVTCKVTDAPWRAVLDHVCEQLKLEVVGCGTVLAVRPQQPAPKAPRVRLQMESQDIEQILTIWGLMEGTKVVVDNDVHCDITVSTKIADRMGLLNGLAAGTSSQFVEEKANKIVRFSADTRPQSSTTLTAENLALRTVQEMAGYSCAAAPGKTEPTVDVLVRGALSRDVVRAACTACLKPWPTGLAPNNSGK